MVGRLNLKNRITMTSCQGNDVLKGSAGYLSFFTWSANNLDVTFNKLNNIRWRHGNGHMSSIISHVKASLTGTHALSLIRPSVKKISHCCPKTKLLQTVPKCYTWWSIPQICSIHISSWTSDDSKQFQKRVYLHGIVKYAIFRLHST